jgi:hypothetical protein
VSEFEPATNSKKSCTELVAVFKNQFFCYKFAISLLQVFSIVVAVCIVVLFYCVAFLLQVATSFYIEIKKYNNRKLKAKKIPNESGFG